MYYLRIIRIVITVSHIPLFSPDWSIARVQALVDHLHQVTVLKGRRHSLLVRQLLVDGGLAGVGPGRDEHPRLEPVGEGPQQLDSYSQA